MLAKFQNIIVEAEQMDDLPGYRLSFDKKHIGTIFLDSKRFYQNVDTNSKNFGDGTLAFDINPEDFKLLNYDIIDKEWILNIMEVKQLDVHNIAEIAGVSDSTIYRILEGKEISGAIKASLFNFFNK